jgi:hypothetical protein
MHRSRPGLLPFPRNRRHRPKRAGAWFCGTIVAVLLGLTMRDDPRLEAQTADPVDETPVATSAPAGGDAAAAVAPPIPAPASDGLIDLTFDHLKFDIAKGADFKPSLLTDALRGLDGKSIRLRGYMRPSFKQTGIKNFVLVRDNQECCFGPGAALYDCAMVKLADGQAMDFSLRPVTIRGTLAIKEFIGPDKKVWAIFRLNGAQPE